MKGLFAALVSTLCLVTVAGVQACDLCGCYTPQMNMLSPATAPSDRLQGGYAAVSEQFTHFGTLQLDGREVPNPTDQYEDSSITQIVAGYAINSRLALQISLPIIYREFQRPDGFRIDRGNESGIGDASLLFKFVALHFVKGGGRSFDVSGKNPIAIEHEPEFVASAVVFSGVKFPTGATSRLKEEFHEMEITGAPVSGIHGHDLTLGTGSYDGIFGEQNSVRYRNFFVDATVEFTLRGDGAHQYHFANDLIWDGGPGYYFLRNGDTVVGLQFVVSGEYKDTDRFRGKVAEDTGITSNFLGPRILASRGRWSVEAGVDVPVSIHNTALQIVPDYRVRAAVALQF